MGVPQLHQREDSLPSSFPSIKPYQRQDNMLRLAALFLLVSAWCLTSEAGMTCADWKGMGNDDWKGMMRCFDDVRSYVRRYRFAMFLCRSMRDECLKKMSDEAENSVSAENEPATAMEDEKEPATAMEDAGNAAAMEDAGHGRCDGFRGYKNCLEKKTRRQCFWLARSCRLLG